MLNMNTIPKAKGKKVNKKASVEVIESTESSSEQKPGNKKRKHDELEGDLPAPVQKKARRKQNVEQILNASIPQDLNKVTNNKKTKKKSTITKLKKDEVSTNGENEENMKQEVPSQISKKSKKKLKIDKELFINSDITDTSPIVENVTVPKKRRKKVKQNDIVSLVSQNGDVCSKFEVINDSNNITNSIVNNVVKNSKKNDIVNVAVSHIPVNIDKIDIEDHPLVDIKPDITQVSYNNLNNNEKEIRRDVNVIDIKNEGSEENIEKVVTISISDIGGTNTNEDEDELLKQLERKLKPKVQKETIGWPQADLKELLTRMEVCIPLNDTRPFTKRLEEFEWDNIIFKDYTVEQCKNMWLILQRKIRKYRVLHEVLADAKHWVDTYTQAKTNTLKKKGRPQKHPDMPRKPLTAYFLFYLHNRDEYLTKYPGVDAAEVSKALAQIFQGLSPEEKKKYEQMSLQKKEEYNKKLEEFYQTHPEVPRVTKESKPKSEKSVKAPKPVKEKPPPKPPKDKVPTRPHPPFHYFYLSELEKDNVDDKIKFKELCKENWKQLPERNKLVWIHYAESEMTKYEEEMESYIKKHPDHVKNAFKPILSKEDMQIKDRAAGKPSKPPGSAYNLFASKLLQSDEIKKVPVRDRLIFVSNQWKYCSDDEKNHYKEMYKEVIQKYKIEYNVYLQTLPEDERKEELKKVSPKMIKMKVDKKNSSKVNKKKKPSTTHNSKKSVPKVTTERVELPEKLKEPQQPPISSFKYFCSVYSGDEPAAQAWKVLPKEQKKVYEEELVQKKKDYIRDFEKFLKSLTEEELEAFSKSRRKAKEERDEHEEESESFESEDSSEEEEQN